MQWYIEILRGFGEIFASPFKDKSVIWILAPIVLIWFILEIYFDEHKKEKLGWNTALSNGISLFWISASMMRYICTKSSIHFTWSKFAVVLLTFSYGVFITYVSFEHKFPARITFNLAAPTPIYFLSFIAVVWTYGSLELTKWVLIDLVFIYGVLTLSVYLGKKLLPEAKNDEGDEEDEGNNEIANKTMEGI